MICQIEPEETVTEAITLAVSEFKDIDFRAVDPLFEILDPDALNSLFDRRMSSSSDHAVRVSFVFHDAHTVVFNGEYVHLQPIEEASLRYHPGADDGHESIRR